MFDKGKQKYGSDIELGKRYRDPQTGIEGTATAITFYGDMVERIVNSDALERKDGPA